MFNFKSFSAANVLSGIISLFTDILPTQRPKRNHSTPIYPFNRFTTSFPNGEQLHYTSIQTHKILTQDELYSSKLKPFNETSGDNGIHR